MKKIKFLIFTLLISTTYLFAQSDTARIKTSAVCEKCKERIEHDLNFEKGVKSSTLDVDTKVVTIIFNPQKTNINKLRKAVTLIGYDADDMLADAKAYKKLHDCCKKDAHEHE